MLTISSESWPGLSRPSTSFLLMARKKDVDARDNPRIKSGDGHDGGEAIRSHRNAPWNAAVGQARLRCAMPTRKGPTGFALPTLPDALDAHAGRREGNRCRFLELLQRYGSAGRDGCGDDTRDEKNPHVRHAL